MKKLLSITISLLFIAGIFTSCEKNWLDINQDPNNPSEAPARLIYPAASASSAAVVGGQLNLVGGMWSQYWTQGNTANQYKNEASFNINQDMGNIEFNELYSGALNDYRTVKKKAKENKNWTYYLMATVMEAYTYQVLVDLYDKIPFSEAFQGAENLTPKYDDGQAVYDSLITRIDNALSKDLGALTAEDPGANDFIFNGDMDKWVQFANTLKLKIYLRQVNARPSVAQAGIEALYNEGANFLNGPAHMDIFVDEDSKSNPLYEKDRRQLNTRNNLRASRTLFDYLSVNGDPRLQELYRESENGGYGAMIQGNHNAATSELDPDDISIVDLAPTDPVYFISESESYFLQAEANVRYGLGTDAQTLYNQGVQAAFAKFGLDGSSFVAAGGSYEFPTAGSDEDKIKAIIMQKWVSMARFQGIEAWTEHRRTGYPEISDVRNDDAGYVVGQLVSPVSNSLGDGQFPMRYLFPDSESARNPNTPDVVPVTTPVWWDQN